MTRSQSLDYPTGNEMDQIYCLGLRQAPYHKLSVHDAIGGGIDTEPLKGITIISRKHVKPEREVPREGDKGNNHTHMLPTHIPTHIP